MGMTSLRLDAPRPTIDSNYRIDIGKVLRLSFSVWGKNIVSFTMLAGIVQLPAFVCLGVLLLLPTDSPASQAIVIVHSLLDRFLDLVVSGALTFGVFQALRRQPAPFGKTVVVGISNFGRIFGVSFLVGLATLVGFCLLIVPGIIVMLMYYVAIPVAVLEGLGAMDTLTRSSELTSGNRWHVLGIGLVMGLIVVGAAIGIGAVAGSAIGAFGMGERAPLLIQGVTSVVILPFVALGAVPAVVVYHDLRTGKEGADIEELVKVFD
jgi:F0F1-type ATP synthase membrane subunit c/vacuolar-type H+-ATPase subunit K